ncbi:MAG TPA: ketose-bisphosphate aldolase [candidate division WOR-3 bacterium]|uniref:Ketose-bisphosphate aldolase n=1 Tax=candidate division WOR-3 bacterium TaxID=2052148 RepID=A0A7V0T4A6_UNCW3|nr:ketose-bisphosphate aldolase [candidate division WOR-3 bacterium]
MKLAPARELLDAAVSGGYALGAFNFSNLEFLQAIVEAAGDTDTPVILATSEGAVKYAGLDNIVALARAAAARCPVPLCLHLDHGQNMDLIRACIAAGYTSVMIDASDLPFTENVEKTAAVVRLARPRGVSVEAELGRLVGIEDSVRVEERDAVLVDPAEAGEFVRRTGVDSLAPAVGTAHGAFKFKGDPRLDLARLEQVREATRGLPLVLHGASSVPTEVLKACRAAGVELPGAKGVPADQLRAAVRAGVAKVNTDTDLRLTFLAAVRSTIVGRPGEFDPRRYLGPGRDAVQALVRERIRFLRRAS